MKINQNLLLQHEVITHIELQRNKGTRCNLQISPLLQIAHVNNCHSFLLAKILLCPHRQSSLKLTRWPAWHNSFFFSDARTPPADIISKFCQHSWKRPRAVQEANGYAAESRVWRHFGTPCLLTFHWSARFKLIPWHRVPPVKSIPNQMNAVHTLTSYFFKTHLNIDLPFTTSSSKSSFLFRFQTRILYAVFSPVRE
jgi:hypothetical protein